VKNELNLSLISVPDLKSKIYFFLKIGIAVSLLFYLISFVQLKNIIDTFSGANVLYLSLSLVLLVPNIFLQYWKWKITCNQLVGEQDRKKILFSLFYGFPAAIFTPARMGEHFGRGLAFKDQPISEIVLGSFVDKFFTVLVTFIFGALGTIIFINKYYALSIYLSLPLLIVILIFSVFMIMIMLSNKEWLYKIIAPLMKYQLFGRILEKLQLVKKMNRNYIVKMFSASLLFFLCYLLQFIILIVAFSNHFYVMNYFWAAVLILFAKSILSPISFGELGVREGAAVYFLTQIGESSSIALNASLVLFFINIVIPSLIGLFLLFAKNDG
jgi:uncharacterized protein (TIRG00374 family)